MMDEIGKENAPVFGKPKPEMLSVGDRKFISNGRWNNNLMADYVLEYGKDDWIPIGRLARDGCGANTIPNKKRVRSRLSQLFTVFLERGKFLAVAYDGDHNSATAVKVADVKLTEDRRSVEAKLERMRKRKEMSQEKYEWSIRLLNGMENPDG
jgi:hypothetical protein